MFSSSVVKFHKPFNTNNSNDNLEILMREFPEAGVILDDFDLGGFLELNDVKSPSIPEIPSLNGLFFFIYQDLIKNVSSVDNFRAERNLYIDQFIDLYFKKIRKIRVNTTFSKLDPGLGSCRSTEEWIEAHDIKYALNTLDYEENFLKINFEDLFLNLVGQYVNISGAKSKSGIRSAVCVESPRTKRRIETMFINTEIHEFMQLLIINTANYFGNPSKVVKNNNNLYIPIVEGYIKELEEDVAKVIRSKVNVSVVNLEKMITYKGNAVIVERCLGKKSGLLFPVIGRKEDYLLIKKYGANYGNKRSNSR